MKGQKHGGGGRQQVRKKQSEAESADARRPCMGTELRDVQLAPDVCSDDSCFFF